MEENGVCNFQILDKDLLLIGQIAGQTEGSGKNSEEISPEDLVEPTYPRQVEKCTKESTEGYEQIFRGIEMEIEVETTLENNDNHKENEDPNTIKETSKGPMAVKEINNPTQDDISLKVNTGCLVQRTQGIEMEGEKEKSSKSAEESSNPENRGCINETEKENGLMPRNGEKSKGQRETESEATQEKTDSGKNAEKNNKAENKLDIKGTEKVNDPTPSKVKRTKDARSIETKKKKTPRKEEISESDEDDECLVCKKLVGEDDMHPKCDFCGRWYHLHCFKMEYKDLPEGHWFCKDCVKNKKKEKKTLTNQTKIRKTRGNGCDFDLLSRLEQLEMKEEIQNKRINALEKENANLKERLEKVEEKEIRSIPSEGRRTGLSEKSTSKLRDTHKESNEQSVSEKREQEQKSRKQKKYMNEQMVNNFDNEDKCMDSEIPISTKSGGTRNYLTNANIAEQYRGQNEVRSNRQRRDSRQFCEALNLRDRETRHSEED